MNFVQDADQIVNKFPALYKAYADEKLGPTAMINDPQVEDELKQLQKQQSSVLQSARQIFSIAINCLQQLHNIKDVSKIQIQSKFNQGNSMTDNLGETIDNYKIQLGKYN